MAYKGDSDLDILKKAQALHVNAVTSFRECHDLCVSSNLFSHDTITQVDQCASDFRMLSLNTVTVSERVSGWMSGAITFFKYINNETNLEQKYTKLGRQAKDLAKGFKVIAAWGRDVSGKLHEMQRCLMEEVDEFQQNFLAAKREAELAEERKRNNYQKAAEIRAEAEAEEGRWKTALAATWWNPIGLVVTGIGSAVSSSKTSEALSLERGAEEEHDRAVDRLRKKTREYEKAKVGVT